MHVLVLMLGGAYTYARVPLGFYMADVLGLQRNPYDKIGHSSRVSSLFSRVHDRQIARLPPRVSS